MKKIIIIIPYFGEFPNYFDLWMKSVKYNSDIDFLLITDNDITDKPNNIKIINISFEECVNRIQKNYKFKIKIPTPYRLSTFKPAYGDIFQDEIRGYDFWGWCDIDLIFGDLRKFLTDDILTNNEKILSHGHLTLLKNNKKMNELYKVKKFDCINYKDAFSAGLLFNNFDEYPYGISRIANKENIKVYNEGIFADLDSFFFTFRKLYSYLSKDDDSEEIIQVFKWDKGKLFNIILQDNKRIEEEVAYVHFQKRSMQNNDNCNDKYMIVPNKFINKEDLSNEEIIDICDLNKNKYYCEELREKISKNRQKSFFKKLFSYIYWKNRIFRFKMIKILKIKPYEFSKGGF
ncbi:DUF6625 family protein [Clostridium sp. 29_15]|uniref:DUF6625 family protein n=1 Tax=Clostridium sp. 29_15 TaxID=1896982 RepID=UPI0009684266|nr:DUF6625 family protein [Clostridium sp. 29_15]OKZ87666.1 MAG: hypothetical protein BHW04_04545 [Clostridium sp. 29_15]